MLLALRIQGTISLAEPLQLIASGDEHSSLYAMWKYVRGEPVYTDRFQLPFSAALYNWLFYAAYGTAARLGSGLFGLADQWLPTTGRILSLGLLSLAAIAAGSCFSRALRAEGWPLRIVAWSFAIFIAFGPLVGFWAVTVRADIGAFAFEIIAVCAFLRLWPRHRWHAVLVFAACAYASWAFKQIDIVAPAAVGSFLLLRRQWQLAAALAGSLGLLGAATLALGSPLYLSIMLFADYAFIYSPSHAISVAANFALKSAPGLSLLAAAAAAAATTRFGRAAVWNDDSALLGLLGVVLWALIVVPTSMQTGSAENYYFPISFYATMAACALLRLAIDHSSHARLVMSAAAFGWLIAIGAIGLVLGGVIGTTDLRQQHGTIARLKECLDPLPRPLFVANPILALPWIIPTPTPFVLSYTYERERLLGRPFEAGGVGGLMDGGFFAAVAMPDPGGEPIVHDGSRLERYQRVANCRHFAVFLRAQSGNELSPR